MNLAVQGLTMVVVTVILFTLQPTLALDHAARAVVPAMTVAHASGSASASDTGLRAWCASASPTCSPTCPRASSGIRVITAFNRRRQQHLRPPQHRRPLPRRQRLHRRDQRPTTGRPPTSSAALGQVVVLGVGGKMVLDGTLTIGELTAFVLYLDRVLRTDPAARAALLDLPVRARPPSSRSATCWPPAPRSPKRPTPMPLPPIDGRIVVRPRRPSPTAATPVLHDVVPGRRAGRDVRPRRRDRLRQVHHRQARRAASTTRPRAASCSTATTCATSPWRHCGASSAWCRRSRSCSSAPSATTPPSRRPEATDAEVLEACRAVGLDDLLDRLPGRHRLVGPRARHLDVVGRAPAPRPGPGLPRPAARARARRGDVQPRPQEREPDRACPRRRARRPHRHPHRPPPGHRHARRPDRRRARRRASSSWAATTSWWRWVAATAPCTRRG